MLNKKPIMTKGAMIDRSRFCDESKYEESVRATRSPPTPQEQKMSITQKFYDSLASHYDKLFLDWQATTEEQAEILQKIFQKFNFDRSAGILDCACGIGTQAIGLAYLGYNVTASDISDVEIAEAKVRATNANVSIRFAHADFCALSDAFAEQFDIVIAMDNALPHMLVRSKRTVSSWAASAIMMLCSWTSRRIRHRISTKPNRVSACLFRHGHGPVTATS